REQNRSFEALAAYQGRRNFNLAGGSAPEQVAGAAVSADLFSLLGVNPILGQVFRAENEQLGQERVVLLGYALWQRRFGGNPEIVGTNIEIDGLNYQVTGVMPAGFQFPGDTGTLLGVFTNPRAECWVPLALTANAQIARSSRY